MHGSAVRNESLHGPSAGKRLWSFSCWCPALCVLGLEPLCWRLCLISGACSAPEALLTWPVDLPVTTVITSLQRNEGTTVTGITSEKPSVRQRGLKSITDQGWVRNSGKLCISLQVATICGLKGLIWLVVPYAAPGGLEKNLARSSTQRVLTG